ncbi:hypothetical protein GE21DRAFT_1009204 [Neurospora crassa]|nr:hypothetical protein GE21DRAFT_1009204 [Neurospora crassa]
MKTREADSAVCPMIFLATVFGISRIVANGRFFGLYSSYAAARFDIGRHLSVPWLSLKIGL